MIDSLDKKLAEFTALRERAPRTYEARKAVWMVSVNGTPCADAAVTEALELELAALKAKKEPHA